MFYLFILHFPFELDFSFVCLHGRRGVGVPGFAWWNGGDGMGQGMNGEKCEFEKYELNLFFFCGE